MLQMCPEAAVEQEGFQCSLQTGLGLVVCSGAEVSVQHRLWRQTLNHTSEETLHTTVDRCYYGRIIWTKRVNVSVLVRFNHGEWYPTYLPVTQNCEELIQWFLTQPHEFLSCGGVAEQVLQVHQGQVGFGLPRLLDAHLSTGGSFFLKVIGI